MFLWPALKDLLDKRGSRWVAGQRQVGQVIHELLAIDYGATPSRIRKVLAGKVPALDCRTFSSMWEERKAIEARALPPDLATKPDDWKKLVPLLKLDRTLSNSEAQAIAGTKLSLPAMNRVRRYAGVPGPKGRPAKKM